MQTFRFWISLRCNLAFCQGQYLIDTLIFHEHSANWQLQHLQILTFSNNAAVNIIVHISFYNLADFSVESIPKIKFLGQRSWPDVQMLAQLIVPNVAVSCFSTHSVINALWLFLYQTLWPKSPKFKPENLLPVWILSHLWERRRSGDFTSPFITKEMDGFYPGCSLRFLWFRAKIPGCSLRILAAPWHLQSIWDTGTLPQREPSTPTCPVFYHLWSREKANPCMVFQKAPPPWALPRAAFTLPPACPFILPPLLENRLFWWNWWQIKCSVN